MSEGLLISAAFLAATYAHFGADIELQLRYEHGALRILVAAVVCMLCMHYYDLYGTVALSGAVQLIARIVQVLGTSCVILSILYYFFPVLRLSFYQVFLWVTLASILLVLAHRAFFAINRVSHFNEKAIVLGNGGLAQMLDEELRARPEFGLTFSGYIAAAAASNGGMRLKYLGQPEELSATLARGGASRVVVAMSERRESVPVRQLLELTDEGIVVQDGGDLYEAVTGKIYLEALAPSWILYSNGFRVTSWIGLYKRIGSVVFSSIGLVLTWPILLLAAAAIRLDSRGPVLFRQPRIGQGGKPFTLYKLRTMYDKAEADGNFKPAEHGDVRVTRVGKWLRRARIDELPQLFNILRGDMCMIGPRPFTPNMERDLIEQIPYYSLRWTVKPGATGWAQVRRGYCATLEDNREKFAYDLFYIKNMSVGLDLLIFFETIKILLLGRGSR